MAVDRMLVWSGPSQLDGTPIVVLATGVPKAGSTGKSANSKTGNMIQVAVLIDGINPVEAIKVGADVAICGTCPHRSKASGGSGACYVNVGQGPRSSHVSHTAKGSVPFDVERFRGQRVRFGSYGDPAAVPVEIWQQIAAVADGVTSYTHAWRTADRRFAEFSMASTDTIRERKQARQMGYRSFVVLAEGSDKPAGAIVCPASAEAGKKTVCASCMMCGGNSARQTRDITIAAHGSTKRAFRPLPLSIV
jgi:hypothetical protein